MLPIKRDQFLFLRLHIFPWLPRCPTTTWLSTTHCWFQKWPDLQMASIWQSSWIIQWSNIRKCDLILYHFQIKSAVRSASSLSVNVMILSGLWEIIMDLWSLWLPHHSRFNWFCPSWPSLSKWKNLSPTQLRVGNYGSWRCGARMRHISWCPCSLHHILLWLLASLAFSLPVSWHSHQGNWMASITNEILSTSTAGALLTFEEKTV